MSEVAWLRFPILRRFMSVNKKMIRRLDGLCSSAPVVLVGLAFEVEPEGTSAYCQLQWQMEHHSCDDYIPPHGESSPSIGKRNLGISELMSKLKSVSVEHRGVRASSAFPTCG